MVHHSESLPKLLQGENHVNRHKRDYTRVRIDRANCTARRNFLPESKGRGRPLERGELIRPLARTRKGNVIAASEPDLQQSFTWQEREIRVHGWQDLVLSDCKVDPDQDTFHIWVFYNPLYQDPLLLATNVDF